MKIKLLFPLFLTLLVSCGQPYQKGSLSIIPKPVSVLLGEGEFVINDSVKVYYSKDTLENYALAVAKALQLEVGGLSQELPTSSIYIEPLRNGRNEEYRIEVTPQNIRIKA
ncbi:MAG: glycoside hydrolase family 20 zincin-like fold domain-containing protein, partial [Rikenellaceae bacterium]